MEDKKIFMDFEMYKREIDLCQKQNPVEKDLYSIVASVLRESANIRHLSLRDVNSRQRTSKQTEKYFFGIGGFPEFLVMSEDFDCHHPDKEKILGAVEIKYLSVKLVGEDAGIKPETGDYKKITDSVQLRGHILSFNKVIYTNGVIWQRFDYSCKENNAEIDRLQEDRYNHRGEEDYKWKEEDLALLKTLDGMKPRWTYKLKNENGEWDREQWEGLIKELSAMNWDED